MIVLDDEFLHGISLRLEPFVDVPPRGPATPCALPDTGDFLKAIAALLRPIIHQEVKEAVGATKIYSASFAIPADRNSYHRHRSFDEQRNVSRQKYMEMYDSGLLTKSEKEQFIKDSYTVSRYPKAYKGYPKAFRERLRKNNAIINDRELEKSFKGEISGKPKVAWEEMKRLDVND